MKIENQEMCDLNANNIFSLEMSNQRKPQQLMCVYLLLASSEELTRMYILLTSSEAWR